MSERELLSKLKISIQHYWVGCCGTQWCVFFLDGIPVLASEDDA